MKGYDRWKTTTPEDEQDEQDAADARKAARDEAAIDRMIDAEFYGREDF